MKLDILGGTYKAKYLDIGSQQTINWVPILYSQQEQELNQYTFQPTPGLTRYITNTGLYSRGQIVARTTRYVRAFCVIDKTLYEINSNQTLTNRGSLTNIASGSTNCWMFCNGNQEVFIGHYSASYVFNMDTNTLVQITDADYPNNIVSAAYINGYLFVVANGQVYFSDPNSFLNWTGSQVYHPTFKAAGTLAVAAYKDKIFNFSMESIEAYYQDGTAAIWSAYPTSVIYTGGYSARTIAVYDGGIIFASDSTNGNTHIYTINHEFQSVTSISEKYPSIQWQLNSVPGLLNDAFSYVQKTKTGNTLYYLFVPQLNTTYCYDVTTTEWHERKSIRPALDVDGNTVFGMFRGLNYINFNGLNLYQDMYSGNILQEDYTVSTEDSIFIKRQRVSSTYTQENVNISAHIFELEATKGVGLLSGQGSSPVLMFETSIDGGHSFRQPRNMKLNSYGDYKYRTRINKLGTGRKWTTRLTCTDPLDLMIQNAYVKGTSGAY